MTFQTISILLPTRGRVKQLDRTLKSIRRKANNPSNVEIVFRCDADDTETQSYLCSNSETFIVGPREKGYASLPKFMNQCAALSTGDIIMMFNDDAVVETKGWDIKIINCANQYPDGIFNIGVSTGLNDNLFPFSIVSRIFKDALGYVNDERLLFSDIFLFDVMDNFSRAIRLPEVMVRHHWAGCETTDKTRLEAQIHENGIVFDGTPGDSKNPKKNWQKTYLSLHQDVVKEAIERVNINTNTAQPAYCLETKLQIQGFQEKKDLEFTPPHYYESSQLQKMLSRLSDSEKLNAIVLPAQENSYGGDSWSDVRLWSKVFSCVYGISNGEDSNLHNYIPLDNGRIYMGRIDDAQTRYRLRDICTGLGSEMYGKFNVLVLNDSNYGHSLTSYFLFKKALTNNPIVIFAHSPYSNTQNDRLVHELESGVLDQKHHQFESFRDEQSGAGFTLEFI